MQTGFRILLWMLLGMQVVLALPCTSPGPPGSHIAQCPDGGPAVGPSKQITLKEAVYLSLRHNPNVKAAELQRVVDKFSVALALNEFEFRYDLNGIANANQSVVDGFQFPASRDFTITPGIRKKSIYGTEVRVDMRNPITFNGSDPHNFYNPSLNINVTHPLFRGSGQAVTQANLNISLINNEIAKLNLKLAIMAQVTQIITDYYAVVSAENALIVDQAALKAAEETVKQNKVRIKIGFMAPSENVQAESAVATQLLTVATDMNLIYQTKLNLLRDMGLSTNTKFTVDTKIVTDGKTWPKGQEAMKVMFGNNPEWLTTLFNLKIGKLNLLLAEDLQRWTVNLTANVVQGAGFGGGANGGLNSIFNGLNRSRNLGLEVNVPIDDMTIQQNLVQNKVSYTQAKLRSKQEKLTKQAELKAQLENLNILLQQIVLAKNAVTLTNQSYLDAYKKATFGQASMFEVTTLQTNLINSQIQEINTETSFLISLANLQQLLGITLDVWDIRLQY